MQDLSDAVPFIVERRVDAGKDLSIQGEADLEPMTEKKPTAPEVEDLLFANKIVKNSKSNAITLVKNKQLCASGIGQTSRVDSLKQAIEGRFIQFRPEWRCYGFGCVFPVCRLCGNCRQSRYHRRYPAGRFY